MSDFPSSIETLNTELQALHGAPCWYVACGGNVGSSFSLSFGEKIRRQRPLTNSAHSDVYRHYQGQMKLLVWCSWRLEHNGIAISSSQEPEANREQTLEQLISSNVVSHKILFPCSDAVFEFSSRFVLRLFADYVTTRVFDTNWEYVRNQTRFQMKPGSQVTISNEQSI